LKEKLITGATRGIGRAMAQAFAAEVAIASRNAQEVDTLPPKSPGSLASRVSSGCEISIVPAVSGG
jgi:NAD(P)-dependent dehydrogenase (short-subunit alcohol dehydrogenase family)